MFKVGDRVWCREVVGESKGYYTIKEIDGVGVTFEEGFSVLFSSISHTSQTMFEKLGYSKQECENIIYINSHLEIVFKNNAYILKPTLDYPYIEPKLHAAIHQQLIELGWLEWKTNW